MTIANPTNYRTKMMALKVIFTFVIYSFSILHILAANSNVITPIQPLTQHLTDSAIVSPSFHDTIPLSEKYTMMMVYQSLQLDSAQQLWNLTLSDKSFFSVTTHGSFHSGLNTSDLPIPAQPVRGLYCSTPTRQTHDSKPCIYTVQHCLEAGNAFNDSCILTIGAVNSTDSSHIKFYEAAYFNKRLNYRQALIFQTHLALKYGITLDNAHYISTSGDTLWNTKTDFEHYNHIKGIFSDSVYDFYSACSHSLEDSVLQIKSDKTLPLGTYALVGDDNNALEWLSYNDSLFMLQRTWKLRTNADIPTIIVKLNPDKLQAVNDIPILALIDNNYEILEIIDLDSINKQNSICYTITHPARQLLFTFIDSDGFRKPAHRNKSNHFNSASQNADSASPSDQCITLKQAPSNGDFTIEINLHEPKDILIVLQDPTGKTILRQSLTRVDNYQYSGHIAAGGVYLLSVYTMDNELLSTQELIVY